MRTEREKIKHVAQELLGKLEAAKQRIDHWKEKGATQARIKIEIMDHLLDGLGGIYPQSEIETRIEQVFAHVLAEGVSARTRSVH